MPAYSRVCPYQATSAAIWRRPTMIPAMCAASARRRRRGVSKPMSISKSFEQCPDARGPISSPPDPSSERGSHATSTLSNSSNGRTSAQGANVPTPQAPSATVDCLRSRDTANLFAAGRTADGDQQAGASLRVMGTSFATGQAAGVAASLFANDGTVDVRKVQSALRNQDAVLDPRDML